MVIELEIQKRFNYKNTERFIRYISHLDVNIDSKIIWIVVLLINESKNIMLNKSIYINSNKTIIRDYSKVKIFNTNVLLQIALNFCYKLIKEGK